MKLLNYLLRRQFSRFVLVGGFGFFIDAGLLTTLIDNDWSIIRLLFYQLSIQNI